MNPTTTIPRLRSPIVLVHGLLGFDRLQVCGWTFATYFRGIPEALQAAGNRVYIPCMSPTGGVEQRATQLKVFFERAVPQEPVHVIAHSLGGLDTRYLISRLGMAHRVRTLTTIGTPHRGTAFADWGIRRLERLLKPVFDLFSVPCQAFYDLTTAGCRNLNEQAPDAPGIRYFSVAGKFEGTWLNPEWQLSHRIVLENEGPNDGIVSMASATYGESMNVWECDHISLVNWPNPVAQARGLWQDRIPFYAKLVQRLADEGY